MGLFAGLNVLPKKSFATDYAYRTQRQQQQKLLGAWVKTTAPILLPGARAFSLDFHPIPYRGDEALLENHYITSAELSELNSRNVYFVTIRRRGTARRLCS